MLQILKIGESYAMLKIKSRYAMLSSFSRLLMLLSLIICAVNVYPESAAQSSLTGVMKCPIPWQVAYPNSTVTFDLTLWNPSFLYDTFVLDIKEPWLPEGWKASFYFQNKRVREIGVEKRQLASLTLIIEIPEDALPGDYQFAVHAEGEYSTSEITLTVTVESLPAVKYEIDFYCSHDWQVTTPGKNLTFNLYLKNNYPERDNYLIYVADPSLPENWTVRFLLENREIKSFSVPSGGIANIVMVVEVPEDAFSGDYMFRVHADGNYANATQGLTITVEGIKREISLFCPFPSKLMLPGQSVSYAIFVTNEGERSEEVVLEVVPSEETLGWDITFSENRLILAPKKSRWIMLNVKPPETVKENTYTIVINGTTIDKKLNSTLSLTTKILASYLLEIIEVQPVNPHVYSGDKINIMVSVRNLGQSALTRIRLNVNSTAIPNILITPLDVLVLEPKATTTFTIRISPDPNFTPGDYFIKMQAVSSETKSSIRTIAISVSSSIPWFWINIGITVIATALVVIALQKVISKYGVRFSVRRRRTV